VYLLNVNEPKPEFIRFPRNGEREPYTQLTRGFLYKLAVEGKIKTHSLRERGKKFGVRLIVLDSLLDYIRNSPATKEGA
jgi:hypothetical protein